MPKLAQWERVARSYLSRPQRLLCGARTRAGGECRATAMTNGRCKLHGGRSTGPKSQLGRNRIALAQLRRWDQWRSERNTRYSDHS